MSVEHLIRTLATAIAFLAILGVYLYLSAIDAAPPVTARLEGMLAVLTPAVLDTVRVGNRERVESRRRSTAPESYTRPY